MRLMASSNQTMVLMHTKREQSSIKPISSSRVDCKPVTFDNDSTYWRPSNGILRPLILASTSHVLLVKILFVCTSEPKDIIPDSPWLSDHLTFLRSRNPIHSASTVCGITPWPQQQWHMIMATPLGLDEEPYLDLGKESIPPPKIRACLEFQTPHHLPVRVLAEVCENLRKRWARLPVPGRNATIGRREGFEGAGRAEGFEEGEGDTDGSGRKAGCLVEDMAGYRVPTGGKNDLILVRGLRKRRYGFAHIIVATGRVELLSMITE